MIINRKAIARAKIEKLINGYSAFAETQEVASLIEKEIAERNMAVHIDRTSMGCWFIPEEQNSEHHQS
ncbi:hypothetical protein ACFO25_00140 [Paenactinomyces guangxiensis]|uniref:Uncharacterized protein n=1 Tax=Paenactinomyces guangxiensis TaxID=1490290 RepID=A0A7W1WSK0_9BACL|nr:hypothetical protein [Paenactinomyces guangxiensis]MBA4495270.1 hypothetical protein [Paenactinomyces guangxiensis]MBH8592354.1 hypothetical protein [Paenactinomyces guangxiensis]